MSLRILGVFTLASILVFGCKNNKPVDPAGVTTAAPENKAKPPAPPPAKQIKGEEVAYKAGDVTLRGYLAYDAGQTGARPGVLVVHEWWGHNEYARQRARQLAEMGYTALAVDMYGEGKLADHPKDAMKFVTEATSNVDVAVARFEAARTLLEAHETTDETKTAAIGYCFGGGVVLHMARIGADLDLVASFHGTLQTKAPAEKGKVKAKVLVLHGEDDAFIPAEQVEAFKKEMKDAGVDMEFVGYPGVKHSFTNPEADEFGKKFEMPLAYDADADKKSWARLDEVLEATFK